jgi:hypothetical protein
MPEGVLRLSVRARPRRAVEPGNRNLAQLRGQGLQCGKTGRVPGQCMAGWQCYAVTFNSELGKVTQIALQRDLDSRVDAQEMPAAIIAVWNTHQNPIINHSVDKPETSRGRHTRNDTGA